MSELDYELFIWMAEDVLHLVNIVAVGFISASFLGNVIYRFFTELERNRLSAEFLADVL